MTKPDLNEEVQQLSWSLIDDQLSEEELRHLEALLVESDDARRTYVQCMQLHVDLMQHYGRLTPAEELLKKIASPGTPVASISPLTGGGQSATV